MSRFRYSGGSRTLNCSAIDSRYVAFPIAGAHRARPAATAAAAARALARRCPARNNQRLALLTPNENEALALTEFDRLTHAEAAGNMGMTVDEFESVLLAAWLCLEDD